ncbi:MAG: RNA methyltransferase [Ruminococcaceae bacterium]|nr:RNA methyltransferase [Oscillospiraceae bacterium]
MKKEYSRFVGSNIFEGIVSLRTLISVREKAGNNDRKIKTVYYSADRAKKEKKELSWLTHRAEEQGFEIKLTEPEAIDEMATGNTHGGIIAECTDRTLLSTAPTNIKDNGFYVMIEGIEDPYNFGYALRSLYAAGADGVILGKRNWMSASGVVCRASAGASELIDVYSDETFESAVDVFKNKGYKVVCADIEDSVPIYEADLTRPILLVIGGEKRGISRSILGKADSIVRIEYGRDFDASLSAASAATVIGFEVLRQKNY